MKIKKHVSLLLFVLMFLPLSVLAEDLGTLRLSQMEGDVQIQSKGENDWVPAAINLPLRAGDRLWVPQQSWAQIETRGGSVLRLDKESSLEITAVEEGALQVYLDQGQVYTRFHGDREPHLQLDTPTATVHVEGKSVFNVAVDHDDVVTVSVFQGELFAANKNGEVSVPAGKMLKIDENMPELMALGPPSDWERWNHEWDESLPQEESDTSYLPEELSGYSRDLQQNGQWQSTSEYGNVWIPTTHVSVDWAPYREGRWVWMNDDFVWVSHEPWGWAPYHYGRWVHLDNRGWAWVPPPRNEVYWGPGYVSWVSTDTDVAWVPLAPREIYYGYGHFGRYSMNIRHMQTRPLRPSYDYRNAHVHNGVTILHRDTFISGHHHEPQFHGNPFLSGHGQWGRPRIEPERDRGIRMPVIRDIPPAQAPPARLHTRPAMVTQPDHRRSGNGPTNPVRPIAPTVRMDRGPADISPESAKNPRNRNFIRPDSSPGSTRLPEQNGERHKATEDEVRQFFTPRNAESGQVHQTPPSMPNIQQPQRDNSSHIQGPDRRRITPDEITIPEQYGRRNFPENMKKQPVDPRQQIHQSPPSLPAEQHPVEVNPMHMRGVELPQPPVERPSMPVQPDIRQSAPVHERPQSKITPEAARQQMMHQAPPPAQPQVAPAPAPGRPDPEALKRQMLKQQQEEEEKRKQSGGQQHGGRPQW